MASSELFLCVRNTNTGSPETKKRSCVVLTVAARTRSKKQQLFKRKKRHWRPPQDKPSYYKHNITMTASRVEINYSLNAFHFKMFGHFSATYQNSTQCFVVAAAVIITNLR